MRDELGTDNYYRQREYYAYLKGTLPPGATSLTFKIAKINDESGISMSIPLLPLSDQVATSFSCRH